MDSHPPTERDAVANPASDDAPAAQQTSAAAPVPDQVRQAVRDKVSELASLSHELEQLTRQMGAAQNQLQVGFLKDRIDQQTDVQKRLVKDIAQHCPDELLKARFHRLDQKLESMRDAVKESKQVNELEELRRAIDPLVDEWAQVFQDLVIATISPRV